MLSREYGVSIGRVHFVPWSVGDPSVFSAPTMDGDYLYAAGWAHRDWDTLLAALERTPVPAILAPGRPIPTDALPAGVSVIDMPPPEEGRALAADSRAVVVLLKDCDYAAGPLVLLDALAMGKPVIASDVNGNRDYVQPDVTALTVPPQDAEALSDALGRLWDNPDLRDELSAAARAAAASFTPRRMWTVLVSATEGHCLPEVDCPCHRAEEAR